MNKLILTAMTAITSLVMQAQTSATINGTLAGFGPTDTLQVYISGKQSIDPVEVGADGKFTINTEVNTATEALFFFMKNGTMDRERSCAAVVSPGETIAMNIQRNAGEEGGMTVTYSGDDAAKPTYANQFYNLIRMGTALSGEELVKSGSFAACRKQIDKVLEPIYSTLSNVKDQAFANQARLAVDSQKEGAYFAYATTAQQQGVDMEKDADFMSFVKAIDPNDTLQMTRIQNYTTWYVAAHPDEFATQGSDAAQLKYLASYTKNPDVINKMVDSYMQAISLYAALGVSSARPEFRELYEQILAVSTNDAHITFVKEQLAKMEDAAEGKPAVNFPLETTDGKSVEFSSMVGGGVVTYVDFWATWCGPCKREIPYLATMVEELKDNKQIRIISISIDEDHDAWRKMVANDKPAWEQYLIPDLNTSAAIKDYEINAIPRFMVFDKEGNLYKSSATRPSEPSTKAMLLELAK